MEDNNKDGSPKATERPVARVSPMPQVNPPASPSVPSPLPELDFLEMQDAFPPETRAWIVGADYVEIVEPILEPIVVAQSTVLCVRRQTVFRALPRSFMFLAMRPLNRLATRKTTTTTRKKKRTTTKETKKTKYPTTWSASRADYRACRLVVHEP